MSEPVGSKLDASQLNRERVKMRQEKHDEELEQDASDDKGTEKLELKGLEQRWDEVKKLLRNPWLPSKKRPCACKECKPTERSIKENLQFMKETLQKR